MAGRGRARQLLAAMAKEDEEKGSVAAPSATAAPSTPTAPIPVLPAGVGRGRGRALLQQLPTTTIAAGDTPDSPPREGSSSSSDQPSTSGAVGSPPTEEIEGLTLDAERRARFPPQPANIENKQRGTDGQTIKLSLNYIKLTRTEGFGIFMYDIKFIPHIDARALRSKILRQPEVVDKIGTVWQFSGLSIYLNHKVEDQMIDTQHPGDGSPMKLQLTFTKMPPFQELIMFYNTTIRKIMRELKLVQIQRHYYDPTNKIDIPQHKLEVWPGYCQSVQDLDGGLLLQCDSSHRLLRTQTAKEIMQELFRLGKDRFRDNVLKRVVGCVVLTRYNNKPYRVDDVDFVNNPLSTFSWNGQEVTYVEYFQKSWQIEIKDHRQPLLVHRPKPRKGETKVQGLEMICLIPELCFMTGLTDDIRSDTRAMKDIASHTRIKPETRQAKLKQYIQNVLTTPNARRHLTDWGLDMDPEPFQTTGRTIAPETIVYGRDVKVTVSQKADWGRESTQNAIFRPVDIKKWMIVSTHRDSSKVDEFIKTLKMVTRNMGFMFGDPERVQAHDDSPLGYVNAIKNANVGQNQIVVCMTPGSSQREDRYGAIKKLCYCEIGVPNQVIRAYTLSDTKMRSVCQKVAIQMSCKVGGSPWAVTMPLKSVMVVGIDVYHDPAQKGKSVVGIVSSCNPSVSQWYSRVYYQNTHQEIVNTLESGIIACVRKYSEVNNVLPQKIVIYRDGVSDGQLQTVSDYELVQIQNALLDYGKSYNNYDPSVSMIVVQKRVNAKLFLIQAGASELGNPPPGSVIDHSITRRNYYDFYLINQHVTQGSATPTRYIVIYDGINFPPDRMQRFSFKMTHLYYNWFGTIQVPAPCMYAHKAAYMVGQVIKKPPTENLTSQLYFL
ncbi:piwi-like protein Ago3 [Oppia nitens]|uniref:piwi-like protein Ago3 n=1 Tax=Oppia nitens TaxID=1686743 RepID=UPI0023DADD5D|nr:piwi-like protein Ago3 [Oppia nitens]